MAHLTIRIEEMEYIPEERCLRILAVDPYQVIVTLEVRPAFPRQLAADLDFVARHPNTRVVLDEGRPGGDTAPGEPVEGER